MSEECGFEEFWWRMDGWRRRAGGCLEDAGEAKSLDEGLHIRMCNAAALFEQRRDLNGH